MIDNFKQENELTKKMFNLDDILQFQLEHDIQVIRGEDYQYMCYIDKEVYGIGLTPLYAFANGVTCFKKL